MKMPDDWRGMFVVRDDAGNIVTACANLQPGEVEEPLAEDDEELKTFMAPRPIRPAASKMDDIERRLAALESAESARR